MYAALNKNRSHAFGQEAVQRKARPHDGVGKPGLTGLPGALKSGIESLSGFSMEDVRVHYNSSKPAQLNAMAYTRGTEIHIAPGQEKHLPHEAWHVVQQMQGRVRPTMQMHNVPVNDDLSLEHEADRMGAKALAPGEYFGKALQFRRNNGAPAQAADTVQCRKAILGRRIEPYRADVDGFTDFCKNSGSGLPNNVKAKYAVYHIKGIKVPGGGGAAPALGTPGPRADFNRLYDYEDKTRNQDYLSSLNMYVKKKIAANLGKADDYKLRVLDVDGWSIEENRKWIQAGRADGSAGVYDSNSVGTKKIGIDNNGKFSLVGLEQLAENEVFEDAGIDRFLDEKDRHVSIHKLKTGRFGNASCSRQGWQYSYSQEKVYSDAFVQRGAVPAESFIAHAVNNLSDKTLLCIKKIPTNVLRAAKQNLGSAFQRSCKFPTVLTQEMEQLQEKGYVFARIKVQDGDKGKIIALPESEARTAQEAARERAAQKAARERAAQEAAAQGGSGQRLAGQAATK